MKVIITGATGMVGEGVLLECLSDNEISAVLSVSRKACGISHQKLKELLVSDFLSLQKDDPRLAGYDACFFCAGVSSIGKNESEFKLVAYDTTMAFSWAVGPKPAMSFSYISGAGTDTSEKGKLMWARVKGKTENDLMKMPFKKVYNFRPGLMKHISGQIHVPKFYKAMSFLYPLVKFIAPNAASTLSQLGKAMIKTAKSNSEISIIEVKDIVSISNA